MSKNISSFLHNFIAILLAMLITLIGFPMSALADETVQKVEIDATSSDPTLIDIPVVIDSGQTTWKDETNSSHSSDSFIVTVPKKISLEDVEYGTLNVEQDYSVHVVGAISDTKQINVIASTTNLTNNSSVLDLTVDQGKTVWTAADAMGTINGDHQLSGTATNDTFSLTGYVDKVGNYEGNITYTVTMTDIPQPFTKTVTINDENIKKDHEYQLVRVKDGSVVAEKVAEEDYTITFENINFQPNEEYKLVEKNVLPENKIAEFETNPPFISGDGTVGDQVEVCVACNKPGHADNTSHDCDYYGLNWCEDCQDWVTHEQGTVGCPHVIVCSDCGVMGHENSNSNQCALHVHDYGTGEVTTPATNIESGVKTYICTKCGDVKTVDICKACKQEGHADNTSTECEKNGYVYCEACDEWVNDHTPGGSGCPSANPYTAAYDAATVKGTLSEGDDGVIWWLEDSSDETVEIYSYNIEYIECADPVVEVTTGDIYKRKLCIAPTNGIAGEFVGKTVAAQWPWSAQKLTITSVEVYPGVKANNSLAGMFYNHTSLTETEFNDFDTSNVSNFSEVFNNCRSLGNVDISDWDTSNATTMQKMFAKCNTLTSIDVSNFNTSSVTNMSYMFHEDINVTTLDIDKWDTSEVNTTEEMFACCFNLNNIALNTLDVSNVNNMSFMLNYCTSLTNLNLNNWDVSNVENASGVFCSCIYLESLDISTWNTSNVTDMSLIFAYDCRLSTLDVSNWDTHNVETMGQMFAGCSTLTSIDIHSWQLNSIAPNGLWSMFIHSGFTSLDLSGWNTSNVTDVEWLFDECFNLEIIYVSDLWDMSSVTQSSNMFGACYKLVGQSGARPYQSGTHYLSGTGIGAEMANYQTGYLTYKEYVKTPAQLAAEYASGYSAATYKGELSEGDDGVIWWIEDQEGTVDCPVYTTTGSSTVIGTIDHYDTIDKNKLYVAPKNGVNGEFIGKSTGSSWPWYAQRQIITSAEVYPGVSAVTNSSYMFYQQNHNASIVLNNFNTANVQSFEYMFGGCNSLTSLDLSSFNTNSATKLNSMFLSCHSLTTLDLSNFVTNSVTNMNRMFYMCYSLTSLDISNFNMSEVTRIDNMFADCQHLLTLDVSGWNTSKVTHASQLFLNCGAIENLDVAEWNTSKIIDMQDMFGFCSKITVLDVSNWNTSNVNNMSGMFSQCSKIRSLDLSNWDTSHVTSMYAMFSQCKSLDSLNLANFNTTQVSKMYNMFRDCSSLSSLDISNFDTSNVTNMTGIFASCNRLLTLNVSSFNTSSATNMSYMFSGCKSLNSIDLSNFDTFNVTDMTHMFGWCNNISTIYVSELWTTNNITNSSSMFAYCWALSGSTGIRPYPVGTNSTDNSAINATDATHANYQTGYLTYKEYVKTPAQIAAEYSAAYNAASTKGELSDEVIWWIDDVNKLNVAPANGSAGSYTASWQLASDVPWNSNAGFIESAEIYPGITVNGSMNSMFAGQQYNNNIVINDIDTSNVTDMSGMFYQCKSLPNFSLNELDTQNVTDMSYMFYQCQQITELDLYKFNARSLANVTSMFNGMSRANHIYVSELWESYIISEDLEQFSRLTANNVFRNGSNTLVGGYGRYSYDSYAYTKNELTVFAYLTYKPIEKEITNIATQYADAYYNAAFKGVLDNTENAGVIWYKDAANIIHIAPANGTEGTFDATSWYGRRCSQFSAAMPDKIIVESGVSAVGSVAGLFSWLHGDVQINMTNLNTDNVTSMESMFANSWEITSLDLSSLNTTAVTRMDSMFEALEAIEELDLSTFYVENVYDTSSMFAYDEKLVTILVNEYWDLNNVTKSSYMFSGCNVLVGSNGTTYSNMNINKNYAVVDTPSTPGYLTLKSINGGYPIEWVNAAYKGDLSDSVIWWQSHDSDSRTYKLNIMPKNGVSGTFNGDWIYTNDSDTTVAPPYMSTPFAYDECEIYSGVTATGSLSGMFAGMSSLSSLVLNDFDTRQVTNMSGMFYNVGLQEFNSISSLNTSNVTDMSYMFGRSRSTTIDLSKFDTSNVINMAHMFDTSSTSSIIMNNMDTSNVENMSYMFSTCSQLSSVSLNNIDTSNVNNMSSMFYLCSALAAPDVVSMFNTTNVEDMSSMFSRSGFTTLDLSNFDTSKVTTINGMFRLCSSLCTIYASELWNMNAVTDSGTSMFSSCSLLAGSNGTVSYVSNKTNKNYANYTTGYLTYKSSTAADYAAAYSIGVTKGYLNDEVMYWTNNDTLYVAPTNGTNGSFSCTGWKQNYSGYYSPFRAASVTNMKFYPGVHVYDSMEILFGCMENITSLDLSGLNTSRVTSLDGTFYKTTNLKTITGINNINTSHVTNLSETFARTGMEVLDLSNWDVSNATTLYRTFYLDHSLTSLSLSGWNTINNTTLESTFQGCDALTSVDLTDFRTDNTITMQNTFIQCSKLKMIDLSSFDTSKVQDFRSCFSSDKLLQRIYVSNKWNTNACTTSSLMFYQCIALTGNDGTTYSTPNYDASKAHTGPGGWLTDISYKNTYLNS